MRALVTGGAGFIGSHLADRLLDGGDEVVVLDDLSTGFPENVPAAADLVHGDVADADVVRKAVDGAETVFHLAAARAVGRSVEDPIGTDRANTLGTLNVLVASRDAGVRRVVVASSSSVYGGVAPLPTTEDAPIAPRSPYAVSKVAAEQYARVFSELYEMETVTLRFFNAFGPRQRPDSAYAAVIPLFIDALRRGDQPTIHGDGRQTRDFTFVDDVVAVLLGAAQAPAAVSGRAYNIGRGEQTTILELAEILAAALGKRLEPIFVAPRAGDVRQSCADITAARRDLGYAPSVRVKDGLERTVGWFLEQLDVRA